MSETKSRYRCGPNSSLSKAQVVDFARRHYEQGVAQCDLAEEAGISASYLARLILKARQEGWVTIRVETSIIDDALELDHLATSQGSSSAVTVNGDQVIAVLHTSTIQPFEQTIEINGVTVKISVTRS